MKVLFQEHEVAHYNKGLISAFRERGIHVESFNQKPFLYAVLSLGRLDIECFTHSMRYLRRLGKEIEHHQIVHLNDPLTAEVGLGSTIRKKRLIVTLHGTPAEHYDSALFKLSEKFAFVIRYSALRQLYEMGARITTISRFCAESLQRYTGITAEVIHHGVDSMFFKETQRGYLQNMLNISNSEKLVLWVGRGYPNKDPFTFLKSVENIAHRIPNAVFVMKLWNKGPLDIKIQKRVEDSSTLRKRLFIVRNISWERLPDLYASCDLFVHTSSNEGFGLAVAEAMSSGKPVIIADRGGPTEFVGKGGLQFKSGDHVDLSNKVEELLLDEDSRKRIAVAAKEIAFNTLSWKVAAERYIELYQA